jgi:hypothetical protein
MLFHRLRARTDKSGKLARPRHLVGLLALSAVLLTAGVAVALL